MFTLKILFWLCLATVFYSYIGYGLLLRIFLLFKTRRPQSRATTLPRVTLFITAWNEQDVVSSKMHNCLELNYPRELLDILWVIDGSTDLTGDLLSEYKDVRVEFEAERRGKCAAMNRGMNFVDSSIVVFTDANTMLNSESLREIVDQFSDPTVGCVAGEKRVRSRNSDGAAAGGEGAYWRYESTLKRWDSELESCMGAAGELFAVRRELFEPVSEDTLLDDFIISFRIAMRGYRIAYCPTAYATEGASADMQAEQKRKQRIAAGGLQAVWRLRKLLNPFKYGVLTWQYVSHRVLRWTIAPIMFFTLLPANIALIGQGTIYNVIFILQTLFYIAAVFGYIFQNRNIRFKALFIPYYVVFMNINIFRGVIYLIRKRGSGSWDRVRRAA